MLLSCFFNMSIEGIKYCTECGKKLIKVFTGKYNPYIGKKILTAKCFNPVCEEGCDNLGHQWGKFWKLENWEKCQRCGYVICDY